MKLLSIFAACALVSASVEAKTFLFPIPQEVKWARTTSVLSEKFKFKGIQNKNLQKDADRYLDLIKNERWVPIQVTTDNSTVTPTLIKFNASTFKFQTTQPRLISMSMNHTLWRLPN